ncbi:MAG: dephospho-CoA kinase [bacterium]
MHREGKIIVGIAGHIGSGKTMVSKFFEDFGAYYISADEIGWEVLIEIKDQLSVEFGASIIDGEKIDRKKLRDMVFSSNEKLTTLNELSHPLLKKKILERINNITSGMIVIDAALLFDWPEILNELDYSILVSSADDKKEERALKNGIDRQLFRKILRFQHNEDEMSKLATYAINNNGTVQELAEQSQRIFEEINNDC